MIARHGAGIAAHFRVLQAHCSHMDRLADERKTGRKSIRPVNDLVMADRRSKGLRALLDLVVDPLVGDLEAVAQPRVGLPVEDLLDEGVVAAATVDALDNLAATKLEPKSSCGGQINDARTGAGIEQEVERLIFPGDCDLQPDHAVAELEWNRCRGRQVIRREKQRNNENREEVEETHAACV